MYYYKFYDNSAAAKAVTSQNKLSIIVYYLGYYLKYRNKNGNIVWNEVNTLNRHFIHGYYSCINIALSYITKRIFEEYNIYISNRRAKRYIQTTKGASIKSDSYFCIFVDVLFSSVLLLPTLSIYLFSKELTDCNYYSIEIDKQLNHQDCIHYFTGFQFELLKTEELACNSRKKEQAIRECLVRLSRTIDNNRISEKCRRNRVVDQNEIV